MKKSISLSFPIFLLFITPTFSNAYVGTPSFSLEDDIDYRNFRQDMENSRRMAEISSRRASDLAAKVERERHQLDELHARIAQLPSQISGINQEISTLQTQIATKQNENAKIQVVLSKVTQDLTNTKTIILATKSEITNSEAFLQELKNQCQTTPTESCPTEISAAETEVENQKGILTGLNGQVTQFNNMIVDMKSKSQQKTSQIQNQQSQIAQLSQNKLGLNQNLSAAQQNLTLLENSFRNVTLDFQRADTEAQHDANMAMKVKADFDRFVYELENTIDQNNAIGATSGERDGRRDAFDTAQSMGNSAGLNDGSIDGSNDGTAAGKQRDYDKGQSLGIAEGKKDGTENGTNRGKTQGIKQALIDLGTSEGIASGTLKAINSDAVQVGTTQGQVAGLDRAIATGNIQGSKLADAEGVKRNESTTLTKVKLNGPYSGLFSRVLPQLPNNFYGPSYAPAPSFGRDIVRRAFIDGYRAMYDYNVYAEFNRLIASFYNPSYDSAYQTEKTKSLSQTYEDSFKQGRKDGYNAVYNDQFESSRKAQYPISYNETKKNPDRDSVDFKNAFNLNETSTYNTKYEEIRLKTYTPVEADTFNKNIKQKIEEAKARRSVEIDDLYAKHPVLQFTSLSINEGGVRNITKPDGYYQPGETVVHTVIIKNFGNQSLFDATIISSSGQTQKLPELPAKSEITIKGAIISIIEENAVNNSSRKESIRIIAPLTSQDALQAVHYTNARKNILTEASSKAFDVLYPIFVSGVETSFYTSKVNEVHNIKLSMLNSSDIIYNNVDVVLSSNASTNIFIRKFDQIKEINSGLDISDAKVMPESFDLGKTISISATLKYKGVTLGVIEQPIKFKVTQ